MTILTRAGEAHMPSLAIGIPLWKSHRMNWPFFISGIFVKRVPSTFEDDGEDFQISSAVTVFRDSLDYDVGSIVLVSVGNLVRFCWKMRKMLFRQVSWISWLFSRRIPSPTASSFPSFPWDRMPNPTMACFGVPTWLRSNTRENAGHIWEFRLQSPFRFWICK